MGAEALREGRLFVRRPDAEWLLGIRDGALTYPELMETALTLRQELIGLIATSPLPERPDRGRAERLVIDVHSRALRPG